MPDRITAIGPVISRPELAVFRPHGQRLDVSHAHGVEIGIGLAFILSGVKGRVLRMRIAAIGHPQNRACLIAGILRAGDVAAFADREEK